MCGIWRLGEGFFFTLCLVIAPTISGHTIPESVPTPFEIPMSMLAYRGAMSKWLTLKPKQEIKTLGASCSRSGNGAISLLFTASSKDALLYLLHVRRGTNCLTTFCWQWCHYAGVVIQNLYFCDIIKGRFSKLSFCCILQGVIQYNEVFILDILVVGHLWKSISDNML